MNTNRLRGHWCAVSTALLVIACAAPAPRTDADTPAMRSVETVHDAVSLTVTESRIIAGACPTGVAHTGSAYVFSTPLEGGSATVLNTNSLYGSPAGLAVRGNTVIVAIHPEPSGQFSGPVTPMNGIYKVPLGGGPAAPVWEGAPLVKPNRIVLVGDVLYVADMEAGPGGSGALFSLDLKSDPTPRLVTSGSPLEDPIGLTLGNGGVFISDRGTPKSPTSSHSEPGSPGAIYWHSLVPGSQTWQVARGGLLKNPLDLELIGDTLYIADEGKDGSSEPGIYAVSVGAWQPGDDVTYDVHEVLTGGPFVEPIALSQRNGELYVADDTQSQSYVLTVE